MQEILRTTGDTTQICLRHQYPECRPFSRNGRLGSSDGLSNYSAVGIRIVASGKLGPRKVQDGCRTCSCDGRRADREETFGPVAAIFSSGDERKILVQSNDWSGEFAAYVYSGGAHRFVQFMRWLEYDLLALNALKFAGACLGATVGAIHEGSKHGLIENLKPKCLCFANPAA